MNNNDDFASLGLEGVTMQNNSTLATPTEPTAEPATESNPEPTPNAEPTTPVASNEPVITSTTNADDDILNDLTDEETIDLFIEGIIEEKGVKAPTEEIQQDLKKDLKNQLLQQIDRSLIAELPDDKLEELNRLAATEGKINPDIIAKMIEEAHLDVTDIVGTTMAHFREIYLSDGQQLNQPDQSAQPTTTEQTEA